MIVGSQDGLETAYVKKIERMRRHDQNMLPVQGGGYEAPAKYANGTILVTRPER